MTADMTAEFKGALAELGFVLNGSSHFRLQGCRVRLYTSTRTVEGSCLGVDLVGIVLDLDHYINDPPETLREAVTMFYPWPAVHGVQVLQTREAKRGEDPMSETDADQLTRDVAELARVLRSSLMEMRKAVCLLGGPAVGLLGQEDVWEERVQDLAAQCAEIAKRWGT